MCAHAHVCCRVQTSVLCQAQNTGDHFRVAVFRVAGDSVGSSAEGGTPDVAGKGAGNFSQPRGLRIAQWLRAVNLGGSSLPLGHGDQRLVRLRCAPRLSSSHPSLSLVPALPSLFIQVPSCLPSARYVCILISCPPGKACPSSCPLSLSLVGGGTAGGAGRLLQVTVVLCPQ